MANNTGFLPVYIDIADEAKRGKEPNILFSWLLKEALEEK